MPQVKAAFTVSVPVTAEQIKEEAYATAKKMNIQVGQFQAGVADDWCVLSARVDAYQSGEAEAWACIVAAKLGGAQQAGQPIVFRLDVEVIVGGDTPGMMN